MTEFIVQLTRPAVKDIQSFPEGLQSGIIEGIQSLRLDPLPSPPSKKKLKGFGYSLYRLRIADVRILYRIDEKNVTIMCVVDRKDLEKSIKRMKQ